MRLVAEFLVEDIGFEHGHGAPDDDHVLTYGFDLGRDELMLIAHLVEDVTDEGREEFFACDAEEFGIIFPEFHDGCAINFGANIHFFSMSWTILV